MLALTSGPIPDLKRLACSYAERRARSEANKELAKLWFEEVWNKGRREAIRELLAQDAAVIDGGVAVKGAEGFYEFFERMRASFLKHLFLNR